MALNSSDISKIKNELLKDCKFLQERDKLIAELLQKTKDYSISRLSPIEQELWNKHPELVILQGYLDLTNPRFSKKKRKRELSWCERNDLQFYNQDYPILFSEGCDSTTGSNTWDSFKETDKDFANYLIDTTDNIVDLHIDYLEISKDLDTVINSKTSVTFLKNSFPEAYKIYKS